MEAVATICLFVGLLLITLFHDNVVIKKSHLDDGEIIPQISVSQIIRFGTVGIVALIFLVMGVKILINS